MSVSTKFCHRNFGPGNFVPGDQNFQWKIGPAGPIDQNFRDICHRNFGPGNFGPGDQNFQWKIGPAGPIFSGKMVRLWKIGPNNGPSISALVTSDCCG